MNVRMVLFALVVTGAAFAQGTAAPPAPVSAAGGATPAAPLGSAAPSASPNAATNNPPIKPGQSRCQEMGQPGLVVEANTSNGDAVAAVRRVVRVTADKRTMVCRELDRNGDGRYDSVRHYDAKGEPSYEEVDGDHDGRIDLWVFYQNGKVGEEQRDTNVDGEPDEFVTFNDAGQISRVRRDRNFDGKIDEWAIFANGALERVGVDDAHDGRVTRWDHDADLAPKEAQAAPTEEKKEEAPAPAPASKKPKAVKAPAAPTKPAAGKRK